MKLWPPDLTIYFEEFIFDSLKEDIMELAEISYEDADLISRYAINYLW